MTSISTIFSQPSYSSSSSPLASQASALDLSQGLVSAQEGSDADNANRGESLEQVPLCIVEKEDTLHRNDGAKEHGMRDGSISQSLLRMTEVSAKSKPLSQVSTYIFFFSLIIHIQG